MQQIVLFLIVTSAALYVGRYLWLSLSEVVKAKKGCGGGCANCAFSAEVGKARRPAPPKLNVIPLSEIRTKKT